MAFDPPGAISSMRAKDFRRADQLEQLTTALAERTALLRLALLICQNQDGTDQEDWATWAAMVRNSLGMMAKTYVLLDPAAQADPTTQTSTGSDALPGHNASGTPPNPDIVSRGTDAMYAVLLRVYEPEPHWQIQSWFSNEPDARRFVMEHLADTPGWKWWGLGAAAKVMLAHNGHIPTAGGEMWRADERR